MAIGSSRRLFRDALACCLEAQSDFAVVGHVADVTDLVELCALRAPHLLLVDIATDASAILGPLRRLRALFPGVLITVVYERLSPEEVAVARRAGVDALVPFSHGLESLLVILRHQAQSPREGEAGGVGAAGLTAGEREIIALIATGHPVHRIAAMLGMSTSAVQNSKRRIFAKVAVTSQSEMVARAAALGLIDLPASTGVDGGDGARGGAVGTDGHLPQLTARETDILRSIAKGHTVHQTARLLAIADKTVENTQARLFLKLGTHSRSGALTAAHSLGLLDLLDDPPRR